MDGWLLFEAIGTEEQRGGTFTTQAKSSSVLLLPVAVF
jgi:hypothetical protein